MSTQHPRSAVGLKVGLLVFDKWVVDCIKLCGGILSRRPFTLKGNGAAY